MSLIVVVDIGVFLGFLGFGCGLRLVVMSRVVEIWIYLRIWRFSIGGKCIFGGCKGSYVCMLV